MLENKFQSKLITEIKKKFPESIVLKNDPNYIQGIPDLLVLNNSEWIALECKKDISASKRPNQEYYLKRMNSMSHAFLIFPENKDEVLDEMDKIFSKGRNENNGIQEP